MYAVYAVNAKDETVSESVCGYLEYREENERRKEDGSRDVGS